jgi:uncharacterized protein YuzE
MKLRVDKESDVLYFQLDDSKMIESEEVEKGVVLDFNANSKVVGVEFLNISQRASFEDLSKFNYETHNKKINFPKVLNFRKVKE